MDSDFEVQTTRLLVRQCEVDMAQRLDEKMHGDESMLDFLQALPAEPVERLLEDKGAVLAFLHELVASKDMGDSVHYAAYTKNGTVVAVASITSYHSSKPELQLNVDEPFQGQGYGEEFLSVLLPEVLPALNGNPLICRVRRDNSSSERLIIKLGGKLQPSKSEIEELTVKTYTISGQAENG